MLLTHPGGGDATVLVVHVNFAVGRALAQRISHLGVVLLATAASAVRELARPGTDVVVLCPYLKDAERAELLAACVQDAWRPAVLELRDQADEPRAHVRLLAVPEHARARAEAVVSALSLPVA
jgi:hypothetical protein